MSHELIKQPTIGGNYKGDYEYTKANQELLRKQVFTEVKPEPDNYFCLIEIGDVIETVVETSVDLSSIIGQFIGDKYLGETLKAITKKSTVVMKKITFDDIKKDATLGIYFKYGPERIDVNTTEVKDLADEDDIPLSFPFSGFSVPDDKELSLPTFNGYMIITRGVIINTKIKTEWSKSGEIDILGLYLEILILYVLLKYIPGVFKFILGLMFGFWKSRKQYNKIKDKLNTIERKVDAIGWDLSQVDKGISSINSTILNSDTITISALNDILVRLGLKLISI